MGCCDRSCISASGRTTSGRGAARPTGGMSRHWIPPRAPTLSRWQWKLGRGGCRPCSLRPSSFALVTGSPQPRRATPPRHSLPNKSDPARREAREFLCSGHEPILFVSKKVFEPDVYSLRRRAKSCGKPLLKRERVEL